MTERLTLKTLQDELLALRQEVSNLREASREASSFRALQIEQEKQAVHLRWIRWSGGALIVAISIALYLISISALGKVALDHVTALQDRYEALLSGSGQDIFRDVKAEQLQLVDRFGQPLGVDWTPQRLLMTDRKGASVSVSGTGLQLHVTDPALPGVKRTRSLSLDADGIDLLRQSGDSGELTKIGYARATLKHIGDTGGASTIGIDSSGMDSAGLQSWLDQMGTGGRYGCISLIDGTLVIRTLDGDYH